MRASEFVTERKKHKRKSRYAAYGPGPYGGYGYYAGYSGDNSGGDGGDGGGESIKNEDAMMGKIADSGKIIRILKKAHTVPFSDEKNWLLIDTDPGKGNSGLGIKWIPADTRFEWVRPYRDTVEQGVAEGATVTRIDSKPITDFASSLKAYKHTDDWSQSGVDTGDDSYWKNKNLKTNTSKGLFAGDPRRTALYATGNAHETRYVEFTQDGQPIVYFDRKDLPAMRSRKTYLTVFDASDFRQLPTGEWFSENPRKPIKQGSIGDPFKYIASQGWIVRVTDDLDKVFKQVKKMHKAGKIAQYGAEGMNESKQGVAEARSNPDQNTKPESGMKELQAAAKTITDPENWAISMTAEPKLGINPQVGISEDTPKGIYFYPLNYALDLVQRRKTLPWGDNMPYIQLFQYDRAGEMTKETSVDSAQLKQALLQYCPEEVIQQAIDEPEYDGTPYWFIYDCLSRLGKSDETNIVRWNKVLRDLGFTSVFDDGHGWIAYNEPTQGVVLDPRIIKQHKTISNKKQSRVVTPAVIERAIFDTLDIELAANRAWQAYDPDGSKLRVAAKEYAKKPEFKQWFGKPGTEEIFDKAASWGRYGARELSQTAWVWYKEQQAQQPVTQGVAENFADGRNPQDKGDSKRHGVPTKASVSTLRKVAKQGGRKGQLAHWMANMKSGRSKKK